MTSKESNRKLLRVTIVYPTDPMGVVPGGTDTCIRDILRYAPDDIRIRLIGVSTDLERHPVGEWTLCKFAEKEWEFYPLFFVKSLKQQMKIPLSLRFTLKLLRCEAWRGSDVLQFHRLEPSLVFLRKNIPMISVIHQNMNVVKNKNTDIRWKYLPSAYFKLEDLVFPKMTEIYVVREDAVNDYIKRFPKKRENIHFFPTWFNPQVFYPIKNGQEKVKIRKELFRDIGLELGTKLLVFVGRLDHQKDPHLLIDALQAVFEKERNARCLLIGDGILRRELEQRVGVLGLDSLVRFSGALEQSAVASWVQIADLMVLPSAYEGMPRCVVEALGCGVPVVSTCVGEIRRLVRTGINGAIAEEHTSESLSASILDVLTNLEKYRGKPCQKAVEKYTAMNVLADLYGIYRKIGSK